MRVDPVDAGHAYESRKNHERLVRAACETLEWCREHATDFRLTDTCQNLTAALAPYTEEPCQPQT
jgi:hypothetical protein